VLVFALARTAYSADEAPHMIGFSDAHAKEQTAFEAKFDAQLCADDLRAWMKRMPECGVSKYRLPNSRTWKNFPMRIHQSHKRAIFRSQSQGVTSS